MTLSFAYLFADPPEYTDDAASRHGHRPGRAEEARSAIGAPADPVELGLVRRMAAGDETALRELYEQCYSRLWDFARALTGTRDQADEVVQEAFVLLWDRASTWDERAHVRGFLYLTVRHLTRNRARRERVAANSERDASTEVLATSMAAHPLAPDVRAEHRDLLHHVLQAIATLPDARRTALVLRWREQLPYEEIARILSVSTATARQLVARARATLRHNIGHLFEE
jgi:RNA polymerase sigma-70 factor (ECF subfamily)